MKRTKSREKRSPKPRILILCEGETERNYFQFMKEDKDYKQQLSAVNPQIVTAKNPAPELVVNEAIKKAKQAEKENNKYNAVWVVFDHDNVPDRKKAYDLALKQSFKVAFSAIAFEKWYLLHFVRSARAYADGESLCRELRKCYPNYEKAKQNDFAYLKDKLESARENAIWLRNHLQEEDKHVTDRDAWTDVDELVLELLDAGE